MIKPFHNRIRRFCAFLIGLVFLVSGILKLMDPVGTSLIVTSYLKFFHLGFLLPLAKAGGIALALLETLCGISLITGVARKLTAVLTSVLIFVFTVITVILLIANPDMDCGCFGKAVSLTHLQSFLKNVVLSLMALVAFIPFKDFGKGRAHRMAAFGLAVLSVVAAFTYSYSRLPAVDFGPYRTGTVLLASEQQTPGHMDYYIYEKDGKRGSFTLYNLPDSTWTFVGVDSLDRSSLSLPSETPYLSARTPEGEYVDTLLTEGKVVLFAVYDPSSLTKKRTDAIISLSIAASEAGFRPMLLLSSESKDLPPVLEDIAYYSDYKDLVSLNRSNGGSVWLSDGMILGKWSVSHAPSSSEIGRMSLRERVDTVIHNVSRHRITFYGFLTYLLAILIFV